MSAIEAMHVIKRRIEEFVEHAEQDAVIEVEGTDWAAVISKEVAILVQEGAEAYLRYVRTMDDAAVRMQLDRELDAILGQEGLT